MLYTLITGQAPTMPALLAEFAASTVCVLLFANRLSMYCDALEQKTDISAVFIGSILLAIVTSLPEAVTTIGSAVMKDAMDLGTANLFGSNTFNLAIIVLLDLVQGRGPLLLHIQSGVLRAARGGIVMMVLAAAAVLAAKAVPGGRFEAVWGPLMSLALLGTYLGMNRATKGGAVVADTSVALAGKRVEYRCTVRQIVANLVVFAAALVLVSVWLLRVCDRMAVTPFALAGHEWILGRTITGTFLLSAATSFPELFVSLAAFRLGQPNMAIANLLGSNMVNMAFIPLMHAATRSVVFYSRFDAAGILTLAAVGIAMTACFTIGIRLRSRRSILWLGWEVLAMLAAYVAGAVIILRRGLGL